MTEKLGLYERVDAEIVAGRMWRAKEILQGNIVNADYDCYLFERYAQLLDQLGDKVEAGRFFFLSGKRSPENEEAISLYLRRYTRNGLTAFIATFPYAARLEQLERYPDAVRQKLEELGVTDDVLEPFKSGPRGAVRDPKRRYAKVGCLAFFLIALACFALGVVQVIRAIGYLCRLIFG